MEAETSVIGFGEEINNDVSDLKKGNISNASNKKQGGFHVFGLSHQVIKGIQKKGYKIPTPIQRKTIPLVLEGRDVVAMARTGSGKTACFLIPLFEKLKRRSMKTGVRALILSPTRELAIQTLKFLKEIGKFTGIRSAIVLGGDAMESQFSAIHNNPEVIVATPGRFLHVCVEMSLKLNSIEYIVFDEADRLFEMGFGEQLREIVQRLPENRQTLLFSATLPKVLVEFARAGLVDPVLVRLDVESKIPTTLGLSFVCCNTDEKDAALLCLLKHAIHRDSQTIIFAATRHHVEYIYKMLQLAGITSTYIYSNLDPTARKINAAKFQTRKVKTLVVTDVAARGIDIPHLDAVINYNFPEKPKLFVHRVGRCARAGRDGHAYSLVSSGETCYLLDLLLFLGRPLNLIKPGKPHDDENAVGSIPKILIEEEIEKVNSLLEFNSDLSSQLRVSKNAYKQYLRSRTGASRESVKRVKEVDWADVGPLKIFASPDQTEIEKANFISQMKQYRPNGTIFEIGQNSSSEVYTVMKQKRERHKMKITNHHEKKNIRNEANEHLSQRPDITLEGSNVDDIASTFNKVITGMKRKREFVAREPEIVESKKKAVKDENFIPYRPADAHTETGLAVNNFGQEATRAELELTGDCDEALRRSGRAKKVWDKRRGKMVGVDTNSKVGKVRSESGAWIPASYKSGRYEHWVESNKVDAQLSDQSDNEEQIDSKAKFKNNNVYTHWGRHNAKLQKQKKADLKRPEQILKQRKLKAKMEMKNKRKNKKKSRR
ncbi:ATP-dependent RNA helicase DDX54 [Nilaparvata lugens]|uniref:ATP-dependent RNA helicase DDX54 n=1 Tax=Nilaparvata lugens TaxID=108931 RepID=UPI00193CF9F5|nr:ATP-dependent RNA helicase DDX54 [Nilaparvata lugens]XP_039289367.1 ATP-dependent RNA helicase DDX54 [Nilaparvata lugens]XP_039289376.1 ATP-dependent RNA helicase DDX54 [Nilaparvata lugens]XP_039289382.1 ATP-dependent RNA helicase DDX54 [Nilaparvata lugens]